MFAAMQESTVQKRPGFVISPAPQLLPGVDLNQERVGESSCAWIKKVLITPN